MAKARIGHFVEAQVLQALGVDYVDESEVLTPADEAHHIDKWAFTVPFVCGATNLGEALRRIAEGAAMIRSKGEAGTGNVVEATRHMRSIRGRDPPARGLTRRRAVRRRQGAAGAVRAGREVAEAGKLPVVLFTAGGIATPADAAMMMQLGAEGVFVGSGIFKSGDPARRAEAIVKATTFYDDPDVIAKVSRGLGEAMVGIELDELAAPSSATPAAVGDRPRDRRPRPAGRRPGAPAALTVRGRAVAVRRPSELDDGRRAGAPGRRVDDDRQAARSRSTCSSRCASGSPTACPRTGPAPG